MTGLKSIVLSWWKKSCVSGPMYLPPCWQCTDHPITILHRLVHLAPSASSQVSSGFLTPTSINPYFLADASTNDRVTRGGEFASERIEMRQPTGDEPLISLES